MTTGSDHVSPESVDHMAEIFSPLRPCLLSLWIQSNTLIRVLSVRRPRAAGRRSGCRSSGRCGRDRGSPRRPVAAVVIRPVLGLREIGRALEGAGDKRRGLALRALVREHQAVPDRVDEIESLGSAVSVFLSLNTCGFASSISVTGSVQVAPPSSDLLTSIALRRLRVSLNERLMNHMSPFGEMSLQGSVARSQSEFVPVLSGSWQFEIFGWSARGGTTQLSHRCARRRPAVRWSRRTKSDPAARCRSANRYR